MSDPLSPRDIIADALMHQHGTIPSPATYAKTERVLMALERAGSVIVERDDLAELLTYAEIAGSVRQAATWRARYGIAE